MLVTPLTERLNIRVLVVSSNACGGSSVIECTHTSASFTVLWSRVACNGSGYGVVHVSPPEIILFFPFVFRVGHPELAAAVSNAGALGRFLVHGVGQNSYNLSQAS